MINCFRICHLIIDHLSFVIFGIGLSLQASDKMSFIQAWWNQNKRKFGMLEKLSKKIGASLK
jgi:hypothetical protein